MRSGLSRSVRTRGVALAELLTGARHECFGSHPAGFGHVSPELWRDVLRTTPGVEPRRGLRWRVRRLV